MFGHDQIIQAMSPTISSKSTNQKLAPTHPRFRILSLPLNYRSPLMAVIMAQAINLGNHGMSETSDIPYHSLEAALHTADADEAGLLRNLEIRRKVP